MRVELANGSINAEIIGSGQPILIMHGGGLDHHYMVDALEPVFEGLSGWQRVYIDLPGHGLSTVDETVATQDDVLNLINAFANIAFAGEKFAVIGESRGSYHAIGLVHTRPNDISGMMLVVADDMPGRSVDWRPKHQTFVEMPKEEMAHASPEAQDRASRRGVQKAEILEKIDRSKVPASGLADQRLAQTIQENFNFSFNVSDPAVSFERPCLIVNGRQDAMAGYQDMLDGIERYPRATLAVLDCAGHSLAWERPELFKALTIDWLHRMQP